MKDILARIKIKKLLKYALYLFLALVTQDMLFTQVRIFGVCPMVLPAVAVAVGMFEGPGFGAIFALILGIFADMAYIENTVTFTLLFPVLAFGAAFVAQFFVNRRFFAFMGVAFAGLLITALVQMLRALAMGGWAWALVSTVLLQTLWSIPPAALAYFPPAKWIE